MITETEFCTESNKCQSRYGGYILNACNLESFKYGNSILLNMCRLTSNPLAEHAQVKWDGRRSANSSQFTSYILKGNVILYMKSLFWNVSE